MSCAICGKAADGPMFDFYSGSMEAHATCVEWRLRELLDPDWEPGCHREPLPLPQPPCACGGERNPLANMVTRVPGQKSGCESSLNLLWCAFPSIVPGALVRIIILPADEPGGKPCS